MCNNFPKTAGRVVFSKCYSNGRKLSGTMFSGGIIHNYAIEYLRQQDIICDGFLIVFGQQWSSLPQRKKIYSALDRYAIRFQHGNNNA